MELTLRQDAVNETYADFELLVFKTVHEFVAETGGRFEDWMEHAGPLFMIAYDGWDPRRSKFSTYLRWVLWRGLQEVQRRLAKRNGKVIFTEIDPELWEAPRTFDRVAFMDGLSEDARLVVAAALDTPWGFDPDPPQVRALLRDYLSQPALGWSPQRIRDSFREIRRALSQTP